MPTGRRPARLLFPPLAAVLLLAAACGPEAPAPAAAATAASATGQGAVLSDQWYEVRDGRQKTGWYHMVWTRSEHEGQPSIHDHTEHREARVRLMSGIEDVFESHSVTDLERAEDGTLLHLRTVTTIADRPQTLEVRREPGAYVQIHEVAGREERHSVATDAALPVDAEAFLAPKIRAGELHVGDELTYPAANYLGGRLETTRLKVQARESIGTQLGTVACWRVLETADGRPGESTWWIDEAGVLARVRSGPSLVERTAESKARELDASAAAYEITLPAEPELPRATSLDRCVVDVSIRRDDGVDLPEFPATPFSRVLSQEGDTIRVELTAHDDAAATIAVPVTDPALARHLEATNHYATEHPLVRRAVKAALADLPPAGRTDGRTVAKALARYVFHTLRKASGPQPSPTAPEILEEGGGDCSEHAVLFVALCRAAGLPARMLSGYAQVDDMWGGHAFCEIWLGRWVGADPTTNEIGTRARYLCFGWDDDPDSYPRLVSSRCAGRMQIRTVEFTDGGTTQTIEDASRSKPLRDDLSGLVLAEPPDGWAVRSVRTGRASVSGPGGDLDIRVSAGVGDLDVADLRQSQFRGGRPGTFGGQPALRVSGGLFGRGNVTWAVPWRRRTLVVTLRTGRGGDEAALTAVAEALLAPTLAP
jgi:transglutaminase-like putative cysteine protease